MNNKTDTKYSNVTSFKDFRDERERLVFRSRIIESKLKLNFFKVTRTFSPSILFSSIAREFVFPKILDFLSDLVSRRKQ